MIVFTLNHDAFQWVAEVAEKRPLCCVSEGRRLVFYKPKFSRTWSAVFAEFWDYVSTRGIQ